MPLWHSRLDFAESPSLPAITRRGFTGHEHLDDWQLVHMNGRVYDFNNGRFLNVDPFIQNPGSTQSLNPYTYVFNNPLSGVDPSGYATCSVKQKTDCLDVGKNTITDEKGNELGILTVGSVGKESSFSFSATTGHGIRFAHANGIQVLGVTQPKETAPSGIGDYIHRNYEVRESLHGEFSVVRRSEKSFDEMLKDGYEFLGPGGMALECLEEGCSSMMWVLAGIDFLPGIGKVFARSTGWSLRIERASTVVARAEQQVAREAVDGVGQLGQQLKNVRKITSGRLKGFKRGNTQLPGGAKGARGLFKRLTGKSPDGDFSRVILDDGREVLFRKASKSGPSKIEIVDPENKFLEKISFPE